MPLFRNAIFRPLRRFYGASGTSYRPRFFMCLKRTKSAAFHNAALFSTIKNT